LDGVGPAPAGENAAPPPPADTEEGDCGDVARIASSLAADSVGDTGTGRGAAGDDAVAAGERGGTGCTTGLTATGTASAAGDVIPRSLRCLGVSSASALSDSTGGLSQRHSSAATLAANSTRARYTTDTTDTPHMLLPVL